MANVVFDDLDTDSSEGEVSTPWKDRLRRSLIGACSPARAGRAARRCFPVWDHLRSYRWRAWLLNDVIAGLSSGVVHVPQGMGFALMAGLPPIYGLYSSVFPGWLYYLFGTSRHLSVGTMALTALMVGAVVEREAGAWRGLQVGGGPEANYTIEQQQLGSTEALTNQGSAMSDDVTHYWRNEQTSELGLPWSAEYGNATNHTSDPRPNDASQSDVAFRVGVAMSVTLLAGLCQLAMSALRLGIITTYMSAPFVSAFLIGSAIQIIGSQVPSVLGLNVPRAPGSLFQLPLRLYAVAGALGGANPCALVSSTLAIIVLVTCRVINERFRSKLRLPIPGELLVTMAATGVSYWVGLEGRYDLRVIGAIPVGLAYPTPPPLERWEGYVGDAALIAVVGFAVGITMAKLMGARHKYDVDPNQELLAYGLINTFGPFFGVFASTQAPPRTLIHEAAGGQTQMAGLVSTLVPLLVCLQLGPLFHAVPVSVLGCIVSCALLPLIAQLTEARVLWRLNRYDLAVWLTTLACTVLVGVPFGLVLGVACSVTVVVLQAQLVRGHVVTRRGVGLISATNDSDRDVDAENESGLGKERNSEGVKPDNAGLVLCNESSDESSGAALEIGRQGYDGNNAFCFKDLEHSVPGSKNKVRPSNEQKLLKDTEADVMGQGTVSTPVDGESNRMSITFPHSRPDDVYLNEKNGPGIKSGSLGVDTRVFSFDAGIFFANAESFRKQLYKKTINPRLHRTNKKIEQEKEAPKKERKIRACNVFCKNGKIIPPGSAVGEKNSEIHSKKVEPLMDVTSTPPSKKLKDSLLPSDVARPHVAADMMLSGAAPVMSPEVLMTSHGAVVTSRVVVDCARVGYVDTTGLNVLRQVRDDYEGAGVQFSLVRCSREMTRKLGVFGLGQIVADATYV